MIDYIEQAERAEERVRAYKGVIEWARHSIGDVYVNPDYFVRRFWEKTCRIYEDERNERKESRTQNDTSNEGDLNE